MLTRYYGTTNIDPKHTMSVGRGTRRYVYSFICPDTPNIVADKK